MNAASARVRRLAVVMAALGAAPFAAPRSAIAQAPRPVGVIIGRVTTEGRPVPMAQVTVRGTLLSARTDSVGGFRLLGVPTGRRIVVARRLGFRPAEAAVEVTEGETRVGDLALAEANPSLDAVVVTGSLQERYVAESPVKVDVVTERALMRNVTANLMDNLPFVNGVAQQVDCGVCFTNSIRIDGMEGPYTAVLIDGAPVMSALATVYGLNGLHPAIVQQIEIIKGPASTLYGAEAMGGVINIITKDPRFAPQVSVNAFATSNGETNVDFAAAPRVGNAVTLFSGTVAYNDRFVDTNGDNFSDLPLNRRVSLFNKWSIGAADRRTFDITGRYYYEDRFGGTREWTREDRGTARAYGESIFTGRGELVGSYLLPLRTENVRLWFSGNYHRQNSYYGTQLYDARQTGGFAQLLWDKRLGDRHAALFGATARYQRYDDNTPVTQQDERRFIPGVFVQDEVTISPKLTALGGLRLDRHAAHGVITSPRLSVKWNPRADAETAVRLNLATGFRVVNLFSEDHAAITGARRVLIRETLEPERSVSATLGVEQHLRLSTPSDEIVFTADGFLTRFSNKIQPDYNTDPNLIVYGNLDGHAVTRGISLGARLEAPVRPYSIALGATFQDVYTQAAGTRRPLEFAPRFQGTVAAGYAFRRAGLTLDYTSRVIGPQQLPQFAGRATRSRWFSEHHLQATKALSTGMEVFGAVKNLFNFQQRDPLVNPDRPFADDFDTYYVYGPLQGRRLMLGARYTVAR